VRYNDETETSNDEINLPDENGETLDTGGGSAFSNFLIISDNKLHES